MNIKFKLLALPTLLLLTACGSSSSNAAMQDWGSDAIDESHRPSLNWLENFKAATIISANGSLSDALEECDQTAGADKYCVITVNDLTTAQSVEIFRSNTKIIGNGRSVPLMPSQNDNFIYIGDDTQNVIIQDLKIKGRSVGDNEIFGIVIEGKNINNIVIKNNLIYEFDSDENAHGIAVMGTGHNDAEAIRNVVIDSNTIHSMRTGSSESLVINGNVSGWQVSNNTIYDVNNIAIDAIGGEGISSKLTTDQHGRDLPGKVDAARYGFIESNTVNNMSTKDNPAYDSKESWAGAIYVDGGHHILIKDNKVSNSPWAYDVGAENCVESSHITLIGNTAEGSYYGDLLLGGYAKTGYLNDHTIDCNPNKTEDENEGHGYVRHITVKNNVFKTVTPTDKETTSRLIQFRTTNSILLESGIEAINDKGNGSVKGDDNSIKTKE